MTHDSHNARILAAAILAGCGAITIGLAALARNGLSAGLIGAVLIIVAILTIPLVWESCVANVKLPLEIARGVLLEFIPERDHHRRRKDASNAAR